MPSTDDPEIFGMHPNANVTYNRSISAELMFNVLTLQPRTSGGGGGSEGGSKTSDETVQELLSEMKAKVPEQLHEDEAGQLTFVIEENGLLPSLAIVLQQEMVKFNRLTNRMATTIDSLTKAINGLIVMSPELDSMYTSCLNNQVPELWKQVSFASLKTLASWVKDLNFRVDFMRVWLRNGLPAAFPLPVFFFPQGKSLLVLIHEGMATWKPRKRRSRQSNKGVGCMLHSRALWLRRCLSICFSSSS